MARAGAGAEAGVDDASTSLYNPASMSRLDQTQFMATAGFVWSDIEFDASRSSPLNGLNQGGDAGGTAPAASAFYVRPLSDRWAFGTNFYAVTGSALDYDDNWMGRFQATEVEILFLALQPTVSYQINDRLSVGAGVVLGYTDLTLKIRVPNPTAPLTGDEGRAEIQGDDTEIGYTLGAMLTLSEQTRIGLVYQSELEPSYSGDVSLSPLGAEVGIDTDLPLAALARLGITHQFNPSWAGHLTVGWEDWDTLDAVLLSTQSGGTALPRNWDDTYHYAAGVTHRVNEQFEWQAGIAYDTNPVDKEFRTADLPIDRQVRYSVGATHTRPSGLQIGGHLVYADYGSGKIEAQGFAGDYKSNDIVFFSMSFNWTLN